MNVVKVTACTLWFNINVTCQYTDTGHYERTKMFWKTNRCGGKQHELLDFDWLNNGSTYRLCLNGVNYKDIIILLVWLTITLH